MNFVEEYESERERIGMVANLQYFITKRIGSCRPKNTGARIGKTKIVK